MASSAGAVTRTVESFDSSPIRPLQHPLEGQLADGLAVLDHEGNIAGAYLECGPRAESPSGGVIAETRIEEPGIVSAQLAGRGVVGHHLGGVHRRNAHPLRR